MTALYDEELRPTGLQTTQFSLLQAIGLSPETTQGGLAAVLWIDSTTLSRTLKLLERERWIAIRTGKDRRERHLRLTREGQRRLDEAKPHWERAQRRLNTALGDLEWSTVTRSVDTLTKAALSA